MNASSDLPEMARKLVRVEAIHANSDCTSDIARAASVSRYRYMNLWSIDNYAASLIEKKYPVIVASNNNELHCVGNRRTLAMLKFQNKKKVNAIVFEGGDSGHIQRAIAITDALMLPVASLRQFSLNGPRIKNAVINNKINKLKKQDIVISADNQNIVNDAFSEHLSILTHKIIKILNVPTIVQSIHGYHPASYLDLIIIENSENNKYIHCLIINNTDTHGDLVETFDIVTHFNAFKTRCARSYGKIYRVLSRSDITRIFTHNFTQTEFSKLIKCRREHVFMKTDKLRTGRIPVGNEDLSRYDINEEPNND